MEFEWFDLMYLLNLFCIWFSWHVANMCFKNGDKMLGYCNLFASALNAVIIVRHFF